MDIFGFQFDLVNKKKQNLQAIDVNSVIDRDATNIVTENPMATGGSTVMPWNSFSIPTDEINLIRNYRQLAKASEIDEALQEIYNEIFVFDVLDKRAFDIDFYPDVDISESLKKKISDEVTNLYKITEFHKSGIQYFSQWYVDGRIAFQKVINTDKMKSGIINVLQIDPLHLRKIRYIAPPDKKTGTYDLSKQSQVWIHCKNFDGNISSISDWNIVDPAITISGLQVSSESMAYIVSGKVDPDTGKTISYLEKALVPFNKLKMMEQSMIIFRVVRAPMRRAFYIDVSGMQKGRGEEYMRNMMKKFKTNLVFNSTTGTFNDQATFTSMLEDYWIPRQTNGKGTEIETIEGQNSNDILDEVNYFRDKLWRSLNVPLSRFESDSQFVFSDQQSISRDEYRFKKFINQLRKSFMELFHDLLRTQLILKNIISPEDWDDIKGSYFWTFAEDNAFVEFKQAEILNNRLNQLMQIVPYTQGDDAFYSPLWVKKNVLLQTDEDIEEIAEQLLDQYELNKQNRLKRAKDDLEFQVAQQKLAAQYPELQQPTDNQDYQQGDQYGQYMDEGNDQQDQQDNSQNSSDTQDQYINNP